MRLILTSAVLLRTLNLCPLYVHIFGLFLVWFMRGIHVFLQMEYKAFDLQEFVRCWDHGPA